MDMNRRKEEDCEVLKVNVIVVRYYDGHEQKERGRLRSLKGERDSCQILRWALGTPISCMAEF